MRWKKIEGLVNRVANKNRVPPNKVKEIIEFVFKAIKKKMLDSSMPKILIHNFGTFKTNETLIKKRLTLLEKRLEYDKITKEQYEINKKELLNILTRLENEKL